MDEQELDEQLDQQISTAAVTICHALDTINTPVEADVAAMLKLCALSIRDHGLSFETFVAGATAAWADTEDYSDFMKAKAKGMN